MHPLEPVFDSNSRVLILGTMPSPKSREYGFYYSHPQNRFWRVLCDLYGESHPDSPEEKRALALRCHIALWDVLKSCTIRGADDGSIRNPVPNEIGDLIRRSSIRTVVTTGAKAAALYHRFCEEDTDIRALALPSTSPANCRFYSYEKLLEAYRILPALTGEKLSRRAPGPF